ncbi:tol-pal system-associated acyl-CoA thioesterase [Porticoccaceae bacterium]|jgi:4-hydroxybenzoyl-CoA thioesterase|nr:tol-pal system-associated acyl-CoA thioesterase [Porticoccaceae bacterium]
MVSVNKDAETFSHQVRVYVEDTDAGGIVFYANYLKYMERARTEFLRSLGYDKPALFDGLQFVVRSVELLYHKPAVLDDMLDISARLIKLSKASFEMQQNIFKNGDLLVEAKVKIACISNNAKRPQAMPADIYQTLKNYVC